MSAPQNPGDIVENFTTQDQDGNTVSLSDFAKSPVVLFFYPRADTPGCTIEACSFRDAITDLKDAGVVVLGISRDDVKAQKKFAVKFHLSYPLLADPEETICDYFGVIKPKNMYGKVVKGIERTTYLIAPADKDGKQRLRHVWSRGQARRPRRGGAGVCKVGKVRLDPFKALFGSHEWDRNSRRECSSTQPETSYE